MKKLFITALLTLPVLAMAATSMEIENDGITGVLGTQYNYDLDRTARQHTADRWFSPDKGYRLSDRNRNNTWTPKNYSAYNAAYDTKAKDDRLYKKAAGEVESVYVPGMPYNVAMNPKNRIRLGYFASNGYNQSYKKGEIRRVNRVSGKYNKWNALRKDGQEYKNMPDMDISGNYKSFRWSPFRSMRYDYRIGDDASSDVDTSVAK